MSKSTPLTIGLVLLLIAFPIAVWLLGRRIGELDERQDRLPLAAASACKAEIAKAVSDLQSELRCIEKAANEAVVKAQGTADRAHRRLDRLTDGIEALAPRIEGRDRIPVLIDESRRIE